jgi:hypothetical protein
MRRILLVAMVFTSKERRDLEVMRVGSHARTTKEIVVSDIAIFPVQAKEQQVEAEGNI